MSEEVKIEKSWLSKNIMCALGFHRWGKWLDCTAKRKYFGEMETRNYQGQLRYCSHCNKRQVKIND